VGKRADPPVVMDISGIMFRMKRLAIDQLQDRLHIVAPSAHIAENMKVAFPAVPVHLVRNTVDIDFEEALNIGRRTDRKSSSVPRILISAADLSMQEKTNRPLIEALLDRAGMSLITAGKHSPFAGQRVTNLGYVNSRKEMLHQLADCDAYLFTSVVDNAPLVVIEALCSGTHVLASPSVAAHELLSLVGGRSFSSTEEATDVIRTRAFSKLYGGQDRSAIAEKARAVFSGTTWAQTHIDLYRAALEKAVAPSSARAAVTV
jgi:glycosyltransferase involved in cell wall biosynthesis